LLDVLSPSSRFDHVPGNATNAPLGGRPYVHRDRRGSSVAAGGAVG
jgi:hypothetical protein